MKKIIIYTDGSSIGNPGPGGWSFICEKYEEAGGEPETTNNRMEIMAAIKALEYALPKYPKAELHIHTDSNLLLSTMTKNWKKKTNQDLWEQLTALAENAPVVWHKVPAHADNELNNHVDILARDAARALPPSSKVPIKPSAESVEKPQNSQQNSADVTFHCSRCNQDTGGLLGINKTGTHIRVDCPNCRSFIKFAPQDKNLLRRARMRPLLTPSEIESFAKRIKGVSKAQLKGYTREEAESLLAPQNGSLF